MINRRKDILKRKYIAPEMFVAELEDCMQTTPKASAPGPNIPGGTNDDPFNPSKENELFFFNDYTTETEDYSYEEE